MNAVEGRGNVEPAPRVRRVKRYSTEIPEGWWKLMRRRKSGLSKNRFDSYLIAPDGKRLRSSVELWKYLKDNNLTWPQTCCDTKSIFSQKSHHNLCTEDADEILLENNPKAPKIHAPESTANELFRDTIVKSEIVPEQSRSLIDHSYYFKQEDEKDIFAEDMCIESPTFENGIRQDTIAEYLAMKFSIKTEDCEVPECWTSVNDSHAEVLSAAHHNTVEHQSSVSGLCNTVKHSEKSNLTSQLSNICLNSIPLSNVKEGALRQYEVRPRKWIPPKSPFNLIQETLFHDPWQLLLATIFLTKTEAQRATESFYRFIERWPTADDIIDADITELSQFITPLGFHRLRAYSIKKFSYEFRHKSWEDPIQLFGIGRYGSDSYKIFVTGEWQNCHPQDHMLQKYVHWLAANYPLETNK
ncbi:uncharacterized protein LOC124596103 [Schistocerca americana]|uniref:uncharacterized protein LOC124596103 n=1 Tax=Schistocerca americana TaxID=7009 RepID=UPI001F4FC6D0|nr:uncharacterized protein LOC124596103 [Schistocerca americana]XP_047109131.1 uncharacterized protein LOC124777694 [Schistocerca piceifrons]